MNSDVTTHDDHIAWGGTIGPNVDPIGNRTDSRGIDEELVGCTTVDHLGVTGDDRDPSGLSGLGHLGDHAPENGHFQAFFENEPTAERNRRGPAHRQIVHGAVDGQIADRPAGKEQRADHVGVGRECKATMGRIQNGRIVQAMLRGRTEGRHEQMLHQLRRQLASPTMPHHNPVVASER